MASFFFWRPPLTQIISVPLLAGRWAQVNFASPTIGIQNGSSGAPLMWTIAPAEPPIAAPAFSLSPGRHASITQPAAGDILWVRSTRDGGVLITAGTLVQTAPNLIIDATALVVVDSSGNAII